MIALAFAALLSTVGAFGLGFTLGSRRERAESRADIALWRELANELQAENGKLRCESTPAPSRGQPPSGSPNALSSLRVRLGVSIDVVARTLGIAVPDVETLEHTRLGLIEVFVVEQYVGAVGCRLDVVAQHVDGEAIWLSSQGGRS